MKIRSSFHFPKEATERLHSIQARSRLNSPADIIRAALSAFDDLTEAALAGAKIFVRDTGGREWSYSPYAPFTYPGLSTHSSANYKSSDTSSVAKNFFFSKEASDHITTIKSRSHIRTNSDVIRVALSLYDELIQVLSNGDEIIVRDAAGVEHFYTPYAPLAKLNTPARNNTWHRPPSP